MMLLKFIPVLATSMLLSLGLLSGCDTDGPAEETGEEIDEAADDARDALED